MEVNDCWPPGRDFGRVSKEYDNCRKWREASPIFQKTTCTWRQNILLLEIAFAPCSRWLTNSLPVGCIFPRKICCLQTRCRSCLFQILETFRHLSTRTVFHRVQRLPKELLSQFLADHRFLRQAFRQDYLLTRFLVLHFVSLDHQYGRMVTVYLTTWLIAISSLSRLCSVHRVHSLPISR